MNAVETTGLGKIYGRGENAVRALQDVTFSVKQGEFAALCGTSGSGKTTLLNLLGGLDTPTEGNIIIRGHSLAGMSSARRTVFRRRNIGFVFQNFNLIEELTVFENIELPLENCGMKASLRKMKVEKALKSVLLNHRRNYFPSQLSGGQQQRVAIARAVVNDPKLILADEPTGNLDSRNGLEIMDLLTMLNDAGTTIVMVTHSEHDARYSHRIIHMLDGKPVSENFLKELAYTAN